LSWPRRFTVVGLTVCAVFICYIDRVNISVAIIPMAKEFGWEPQVSLREGLSRTVEYYRRNIDHYLG